MGDGIKHETQAMQFRRDMYQLTSTARGEMAIVRGSPSSPVLGFCVTFVAGRMAEEEKLAKRWRVQGWRKGF